MPPRQPTLVAVGPWDHAEFAAMRDLVDPDAEWGAIDSLEALAATLVGGVKETDEANNAAATIPFVPLPPELVLLAQPRPDAMLAAQVERLRAVAPLTRVVVIAGTWCEGELRTGAPPAGVVRLYWYEFAAWWRAALAAYQAGGAPAWSEPLDDVRAGQATTLRSLKLPPANSNGSTERGAIAVDAVDFAVFEALAAALAPFGWRCEWQPRHRPELHSDAVYAAAIWDGGQLSEGELASLATFATRVRESSLAAPVIVLLDFPRVEHSQAARNAGGTMVLGKPYQVTHLANELERLVGMTV
jgi:hypothetical protein